MLGKWKGWCPEPARGELVSQEEISHHFNHFAGDIGAETVRGSDGLNNISVRTA